MKLEHLLKTVATAMVLVGRLHAQVYETNGVAVQTFVGSGFYGYYDGQGVQTMFNYPGSIVRDSFGNLLVLDRANGRIRKITPSGEVSTFAGNGQDNPATPTPPGYGTNVSLGRLPYFGSMTIDSSNDLYVVSNSGSYDIKKVRSDGYVYTAVLSSASYGIWTNTGLCVDSKNNLYFSTSPWAQSISGNKIYRYTTNGALEVFAGSGNQGSVDGNWIFSSFDNPAALACDSADNIYVWDSGNHLIRRINQNRDVETIAGREAPDEDGVGQDADFKSIAAMSSDNFGNIYLACNSSVRRISAATNVTTIAGNFAFSGYANGPGNMARFYGASGVCVSGGTIYVSDALNHRIRSITNNAAPQLVLPANLELKAYPGLKIIGTVGRTYEIQSSPEMTNWTPRATLLLTSNPYLWIDQNPIAGAKYYRALLLP